jgi:hypothetical protein
MCSGKMGRTIKSNLNSQNTAINSRYTYPMIIAPVEGPAGMVSCATDVDLDLPSTARASHERNDGREDGRATHAAAQRRSGGAAERHGGEARPHPSSGDSGGRRCGAGRSELRRQWELGTSTRILRDYVPMRILQINHSALSSNTRVLLCKKRPRPAWFSCRSWVPPALVHVYVAPALAVMVS